MRHFGYMDFLDSKFYFHYPTLWYRAAVNQSNFFLGLPDDYFTRSNKAPGI